MKPFIFILLISFSYTLMGQQTENSSGTYNYLLFVPEQDPPEDGYPLMLFLHGSGERGSDLSLVKTHGPPSFLDDTTDFQFVVVSPQCPAGEIWNPSKLLFFLDELIADLNIDQDRIYLTGLSIGGTGTWELAMAAPDRFAAIAPICGIGNTARAFVIRDIPCWVFHGAKDDIVPCYQSDNMVEALKLAGANVRYTKYPDEGHLSWIPAYADPELYEWMLEQKKNND